MYPFMSLSSSKNACLMGVMTSCGREKATAMSDTRFRCGYSWNLRSCRAMSASTFRCRRCDSTIQGCRSAMSAVQRWLTSGSSRQRMKFLASRDTEVHTGS